MSKPVPLVWNYSQAPETSMELPYWVGWTGNAATFAAVRVYDLGNKDWIIVAIGPAGSKFKHNTLSLFHLPWDKAKETAERLVHDLWS